MPRDHDDRLIQTFQYAASTFPWYRALLDEQGVVPETIRDVQRFREHCPVLTKLNTFDRFPIGELAATTSLADLASVLTSSGHGGRFSFGLTTRAQEAAGADAIDDALDAAFDVRTRSTLTINCLPMGVTFASRCMTVATTSVREDMAVALVQTFGRAYAQVLLVADPLFLKRLIEHARTQALNWRDHRVNVVVGEEVFGEHFRRYVASALGLGREGEPDTFLMSSFGVGELGLHLCFETRATAGLRRLLCEHDGLAHEIFGAAAAQFGMPMLFTCEPSRTFVEVVDPAGDGFGRLTFSMLDQTLPIPLLRYQTGDIARVLDAAHVGDLLRTHGLELPGDLPPLLIALRGRDREALPNGAHVALYKDAIYADAAVADRLTGAVRMTFDGGNATLHVQLERACHDDRGVAETLQAILPAQARPRRVVVWPYVQFPFGMTLDYERKFSGC